ncbi:hypothetical protein [Velocimicrobium porci]|uniref:Uncharacterized protein n=1 Tax=Velocimicrobium porci TaxID=2606634 RepID=A0A6L5XZ21_9FIRM|nr:hypothetical protein [Velocimicrobium porci]MSS64126.1 hypothetical protein [Velocimicrobium porci]
MKEQQRKNELFFKIKNQTEELNQLMKEYCKDTNGKLDVSVEHGKLVIRQEYRNNRIMMEELEQFFQRIIRAVEG